MKSTVTPTPRVDIVQLVQAEMNQIEEHHPDLAPLQSIIRKTAEDILAKLPDIITSRNVVTWRCEEPANMAVTKLSFADSKETEGTNEKTAEALMELKNKICRQITLRLYESYLQDIVAEINTHQAKNKPVPWGIGSVRRYQKGNEHSKLDTFIHFWRKYIEPEGREELFRKIIVSKLSPKWQTKYQQVVNKECPYDWHSMTNKKIAETLVSLKRERDPSQKCWILGSLQAWTGEKGEQWGVSFAKMWTRKYKGREDKEFRAQILPHLPIEWQNTFVLKGKARGFQSKCPHNWDILSTGKIVDIIKALKRSYDPATHVWNFGSIAQWTDMENGKLWGRSFHGYWTAKHGTKAEEQFKAWILTYLPPEWKKTYYKRKMKDSLTTS